MKKEIKFSLVYRDMWQSSGKYVPRKDQLAKIAPVIIDMGCFDRVETNGGAMEQVNLLYGENPNQAVRTFTKPFNEVGIKTHMLDRGLNALRMNPVPADVRQLMYKVKHAQGVDITRIFCGLNDPRNIIPSIKWAKEAGMTAQATMCITYSKVHNAEYYINLAEQLIEGGAQEICLKDMAGIGRPAMLGTIVRAIKEKHPDIVIQYHGHNGPGFAVASMLEVARAGADVLDVAMEPLSWGKVHPDVITIQAMLKDAGFLVKDINMKAYMEARSLTQSFMDDFLGYWIDPKNSIMSSLLVGCGLPGGMMGSLMADLKGMHAAINANLRKKGEKELSEDELLVELFVTPFSQYVKNAALMNLYSKSMDEKPFTRMDPAMWGMVLGKSGKLPGELAPEIIQLAKEQGKEFYTDDPQVLYPNDLPRFIKEMEENGWDRGQDDEELFEFAMHEKQYREYKSGAVPRVQERSGQGSVQQGPYGAYGEGSGRHRRCSCQALHRCRQACHPASRCRAHRGCCQRSRNLGSGLHGSVNQSSLRQAVQEGRLDGRHSGQRQHLHRQRHSSLRLPSGIGREGARSTRF